MNDNTPNTLFTYIRNGMNSIFTIEDEWILFSDVNPVLRKWIDVYTRNKGDKDEIYYSFNIDNLLQVYLIKKNNITEVKTIKGIMNNEKSLFIILPKNILELDTDIIEKYVFKIYSSIFNSINEIFGSFLETFKKSPEIFTMYTMNLYFDNFDYKKYYSKLTDIMSKEQFDDMCKNDLEDLYDNLKILNYITIK